MSNSETGPKAAVSGAVEDVKGKAKEVVGDVVDNEELREEGRAQQDKARAAARRRPPRGRGREVASRSRGPRGRGARPSMNTEFGYTLSIEEHAPTDLVAARSTPRRRASTSSRSPTTTTRGSPRRVTARSCGRCSGAIAASTERIEVGVGVTCPIMRIHPGGPRAGRRHHVAPASTAGSSSASAPARR